MKQTVIQWIVLAVAALVAGPIAGRLVEMSHAADGAVNATALISESPAISAVLYAAAFLIAGIVGVAAARVSTVGVALASAGIVLAWVAWRTARIEDVLRLTHSASVFRTLAIEGLLLGVIGVAVAALIARVGRKGAKDDSDGFFSGHTLAGLGAGVLAGAIVGWGIARTDASGQAFAAAIGGGIAAATIGRIVSIRTPIVAFVGVGAILAVGGPALGAAMNGSDAVRAAYAGSLIPLARLMPIDWIAGMLIGVPIGTSWAAAMVHKHAPA